MTQDTTPKSDSERWQKTLIAADSRIQDAISSLNDSGLQIALVVAADGMLIGTITDGDIRRGLVRGLVLDSSVADIMNREPLVVPPLMSREMSLQLMRANKIHQLPVVDDSRRIVGLHVWADIDQPIMRDNIMILMAGGQGARLRPHTESCPKPLLPVGGKPMLEHILERAKAQGFGRFLISIHYLGHMIEAHFRDGRAWNVDIEYLREPFPLGTAGALSRVHRPEKSFVVSNGDVLTDIHYGDLLDFHVRYGAIATMAVRLHEWQHPFGVVQIDGIDITGFDEKPVARHHINAGVYALHPDALDALAPDEPCDMPLLFTRLRDRGGRTIVYPMHEPWLDVGRPEDLRVEKV